MLKEVVTEAKTLGPAEPMISKIRNMYLMTSLMKIPRGRDLQSIKARILQSIDQLHADKKFRTVKFIVDVDPI